MQYNCFVALQELKKSFFELSGSSFVAKVNMNTFYLS